MAQFIFGNLVYTACLVGYASPRNNAIQIYADDGAPYDKPSINPDCKLESDEVALHPAPYHKKIIDALIGAKLISEYPHRTVKAGNYAVPVHRLSCTTYE